MSQLYKVDCLDLGHCTHISIRGQAPDSEGGIDFEGHWRDIGGESKESPFLRGESKNLTNFRGGIL